MPFRTKLWFLFFLIFLLVTHRVLAQDEYAFDLSEIEKRPYQIGGYLEFRPVLFGLDRDAALYKLRFYNRDEGKTIPEYNLKIQLDGGYEWGRGGAYIKVDSELQKSYLGWSDHTGIYEGYLSLKPSFSLSIELGKRQLKWGKGYAWNPVAFIDRIKNPDDPEISLEGYVVAKADYIKSFNGPLRSLALTPVLVPVYENINEDFGKLNDSIFSLKTYLLFYDTDIDFILFAGGRSDNRYGVDFSRNIKSNFEIHGELALIEDSSVQYIDSNGQVFERHHDAESYLIGFRFLTESDTTYICEYYHNGRGFYEKEITDYFSFIHKGYTRFISSGDESDLKEAFNITRESYGRINPMRDYIFLRVSQKEPFDILYFTPSLTWIYNISDESYSLSPEVLYNPVTNLELRLKMGLIHGRGMSEYGEKQNSYRFEFRIKYYY